MTPISRRQVVTAGALTVPAIVLGAPSALAWDAARLGPTTLRLGSVGAYLQTLKWVLNKVGKVQPKLRWGKDLAAEVFDQDTHRAVRAFQAAQGLYADGIAGPKTKARLDALLDAHYSGDPAAPATWFRSVGANVRSGASMRYAIVGYYPAGTTVQGVKQPNGWVRTDLGHVHASRLTPIKAPTDPAPGNGAGLLPPVTRITPVQGGVPMGAGWNNTRVRMVLERLKVPHGDLARTMNSAAVRAVRRFQGSAGLRVTGVVDLAARRALGFAAADFTLDAWQQQPVVGLDATPGQRIETMIDFAMAQLGSDYTWSGAGPAQYGFDCSGLVLQAMYAAGVGPQPINVVKHAEPTYRATRNLWAETRIGKVPVAQRRRGDIIWYTDAGGVIRRVPLCPGGGKIIDQNSTVKVRDDVYALNRGTGLAVRYRKAQAGRVFDA